MTNLHKILKNTILKIWKLNCRTPWPKNLAPAFSTPTEATKSGSTCCPSFIYYMTWSKYSNNLDSYRLGLQRLRLNALSGIFLLADHRPLLPRRSPKLQYWVLRGGRGLRDEPLRNLQKLHVLLVLGRRGCHHPLHRSDAAVRLFRRWRGQWHVRAPNAQVLETLQVAV